MNRLIAIALLWPCFANAQLGIASLPRVGGIQSTDLIAIVIFRDTTNQAFRATEIVNLSSNLTLGGRINVTNLNGSTVSTSTNTTTNSTPITLWSYPVGTNRCIVLQAEIVANTSNQIYAASAGAAFVGNSSGGASMSGQNATTHAAAGGASASFDANGSDARLRATGGVSSNTIWSVTVRVTGAP